MLTEVHYNPTEDPLEHFGHTKGSFISVALRYKASLYRITHHLEGCRSSLLRYMKRTSTSSMRQQPHNLRMPESPFHIPSRQSTAIDKRKGVLCYKQRWAKCALIEFSVVAYLLTRVDCIVSMIQATCSVASHY
jgi:hypothetical protein